MSVELVEFMRCKCPSSEGMGGNWRKEVVSSVLHTLHTLHTFLEKKRVEGVWELFLRCFFALRRRTTIK